MVTRVLQLFLPHIQVPDNIDEEAEATSLQMHFEQQLRQLGMQFGRGGFQLKSVRHQDGLDLQIETDTAPLLFSGLLGTDAVVVPYGELFWQLQLRMVIDWKTPDSLQSVHGVQLQQMLQLMGGLFNSHDPAVVVFTDLVNFVIYQPYAYAVR